MHESFSRQTQQKQHLTLSGFIVLMTCLLQHSTVALAQDIAQGAEVFNASCAGCHGADGNGGQMGPSLLQRVNAEDDASLMTFIQQGVPEKGMPPSALPTSQFPDLLAYLDYLAANVSAGTMPPGSNQHPYASMPAIDNFQPVTDQLLLNPDPADWLWFSRTADAQRFSPLQQINTNNVDELTLAWSRGLPAGITETIPTVYDGVMYLTLPGSNVVAMDATTGDVIWEYERNYGSSGGNFAGRSAGSSGRSKTLAIYQDMIYFAAPDDMLVALDAVTGELRWESPTTGRGNTSGAIAIAGKVFTGGTCREREDCYISAHDANTGELLWKFNTVQFSLDPSQDSWYGLPLNSRVASTWGLPGSYDAEHDILYWSVANPSPYTRVERHGSIDAAPMQAPVDLYSNSTLALNPHTGELLWYYQHLPGDDWDEDMNQERMIVKTPVRPDAEQVRWINPDITPGEERSILVNIGEGGGLWALDSVSGQFLWATPFPENVSNFVLSDIDVRTGATEINRELLLDRPGAQRTICFFNTRSYWPGAYSPKTNSLYMPYIKNCLNMRSASPASAGEPARPQSRTGSVMAGVPLDELNGLAKVNLETGAITQWPTGAIPTTSAILATAGDLIFWGDINRRFRAQHADTGEVLWETILGGPISVSNISYSVNGKQYIAVIAGENMSYGGLNTGGFGPVKLNLANSFDNNSLYVFALPDK